MPHARLSAVAVLTLAAAALGQAIPPMMPMTAPPASAPASAPASQPEDVAAIQKALADYNTAVAAGDAKTLEGFVVVSTDLQRRAMSLMGRLTTSGRSVYQAAVDKFGEAELKTENVDRTSFPAGFPPLPSDQMDIRPDGDRASLLIRTSAEAPPLAMKRVGGAWKIDGDALLPPMTEKQLTEQTSVLNAAIAAIDQTADDIKAGHFRAADEIVVLMNHRVQKAVRLVQAKLAPMEEPAGATAAPAGPTTTPATQMP